MSLAIKKFADGGSPEVRTYKRGNDEVDLNAFVRLAEAGFNDWLDKTDIKEKHKKEVRAAYQDMITRINDDPESFVARLGGGFTNTAGITNKKKGFDAYGIAAGYLGNTLRGMSVYTKPEVKSDKSKYKRDEGFITSKMLSQIWGNSPESFIRLDDDSYDENTGQRGITNRVAQTVAGLEALKERLKDYYDFDSDEDYNHAISRINSAITSLLNANPNDDWFTLGLLGITGMNKFFSTGKERSTTPRTQEELTQIALLNGVRDFENWMSSNRPFYTGLLSPAIPIGTEVGTANELLKTELRNKLNSLSKDDVNNWILSYIVNPSYDFSQYPTLRRIYRGLPSSGLFTNALYISGILELALKMGELKNISGTNTYYIPSTLETYPDRSSTVYIYDADSLAFLLVDTLDVPDYRKLYLNEYRLSNPSSYLGSSAYSSRYPEMYPSHKEGGVIKALGGATLKINPPNIELPDPFADLSRQQNLEMYNSIVSPDWARLNYGTDPNNLDDKGNARVWGAYDVLTGWTGKPHDKRTERIGTTPQTPTISNAYRMLRNYINSGNMVGDVRTAYKKWLTKNLSGKYKDFVEYYNNKVDNIRKLGITRFQNGQNSPGYLQLFDDYNELYSSSASMKKPDFSKGLLGALPDISDLNGSTMFNRNALAFNSDEDAQDLRSGTFIDNDPSNTLFWINNEGKLELRTVQPEGGQDPGDQVDPNLLKGPNKEVDPTKVNLDELQAKLKGIRSNASLARQGFWEELGTDLLGVGRLAGSIWANNRIARIVRDSLRPKLHDTYELYSPVTGASREMQLLNRLGAKTLSQSYRPFTSDASLASARMLEGQRQANDLQYQGFLADDREIRRTLAEALLRQEGNIARHSALANENRDTIIDNNQAVALLEASKVKQNLNSVDNYLKGDEGRLRERLDYYEALRRRKELKDEYDQKNYVLILDLRFNASQYEPELKLINELISAWEKANPTKSAEKQSWYKTVSDRRTELADRLREDNLYSMALRRGWEKWTNKYRQPGKYYDPASYDWRTIIRRNGGTLRLSSSQLIDKIIRKNEGNS